MMTAANRWSVGVVLGAVLLAPPARAQTRARLTIPPPQRFAIAPRYQARAGIPPFGIPLAVGHLNQDGFPDIAISSGFVLSIFANRGDGTFDDTKIKPPSSPFLIMTGLAIADIDQDGDHDLIVVGRAFKGVVAPILVYINNGSGRLTLAPVGKRVPQPVANALSVAVGDLDGDGDADLVVGNRLAQNRLYLNDGKGFFKDVTNTHMPFDSAYTRQIVLADLDGDGDLDMAMANGSKLDQSAIYWNDGKARFTRMPLVAPPGNSYSVAAGDVDGDGDLDLVFGFATQQDRLYLNDGKHRFRDATHLMPVEKDWSHHVVLGDLDADGDLDLVASTGGLRLYLNDGNGRFTNQTEPLMPFERPFASFVGLSDLDRDGDLDLIVNGTWRWRTWPPFDPNTLKFFMNLGRQVYTQPRVVVGGPLGLLVFADPGQVAYPILGLDSARIRLGPLGLLGVDPRTAIRLPPRSIPPWRHQILRFDLPPDPRLRGRTLYTQALIFDPARPARSHLTNWMVDPIR